MTSANVMSRLASLNLPTEAFQEVLSIIAEMQAVDESRRAKQRARKNKQRHANVTGQERDSHRDIHTKERSPIPPKENTSSELPRGSSSAAGAASKPIYTDSKHELWGEGTAILQQLGLSERSAKSNIGRWLKDAKDDSVGVLGAIQRARDNRIIDPVPWITRAIKPGSKADVAENRSLVAAARRAAERFSGAPRLGDGPGEPVLRLISES